MHRTCCTWVTLTPNTHTRPAVNRRMDDWVCSADFDLSTVEPEVVEVSA
jgi:hypothetical protein